MKTHTIFAKSPSFASLFLTSIVISFAAAQLGFAQGRLPSPNGPGGVAAVKGWAHDRLAEGEKSFQSSGFRRMPSPGFWGDEVVYQIQVDRFNNGDPTNDQTNVSSWQREHQFGDQLGLPDYRHGGDLQGIINRLDYLAELGVTSLWITPIFMNDNGSYHGYCTSDFTQIDPGFGSNEKFRELVARAHSKGIRVVLDIVVNHMCNETTKYDNQATPFNDYYYGRCLKDLDDRYWKGTQYVSGQRNIIFSSDFFGPFQSQHFFNRCGYRPGDFSSQGVAAIFGDFSDKMLDFDTNNWDFQDIFTDLHKFWVAYADIDGFRVDAAKHVTADFVAKFSTDIRAYAESLGKRNFFLVGEVAGESFEQALRVGRMRSNVDNPNDPSSTTPATLRARMQDLKGTYQAHQAFPFPGLNAVYDFAQSGTTGEAWRNSNSPAAIKRWFYTGGETDNSQCAGGYCELLYNGDPRLNWTVLEIHDWPRFALWGASARQMIGAAGHLMTTLGTPVLYYGYEQGLNGNCHTDRINLTSSAARDEVRGICTSADVFNHSRYRQDMFMSGQWRLGSVIPEIDRLAGIEAPTSRGYSASNWREDPYLNMNHDLIRSIRQFIAIRKSCAALRRGNIYFRAAHEDSRGGLLAFSRIQGGEEVLVLINTSERAIPISALTIDAGLNQEDYRVWVNLLNPREKGTTGSLGDGKGLYFFKENGGKKDSFFLEGRSVAVFVDAANTKANPVNPGLLACRTGE